MFPHLRQQILARVDLVVEFSTLGAYGVDEHGAVMQLDCEPAPAKLAPRRRDRCGDTAQPQSCASAGSGTPARP